jgi:hypothetical protein
MNGYASSTENGKKLSANRSRRQSRVSASPKPDGLDEALLPSRTLAEQAN